LKKNIDSVPCFKYPSGQSYRRTLTPAALAYIPPDLKIIEFIPPRDRAFFADSKKTSLLGQATAIEEVTPYIGSELKGIQLSKLFDRQKDELGLLVSEVSSRSMTSGQFSNRFNNEM
jgi:hypothetical protein